MSSERNTPEPEISEQELPDIETRGTVAVAAVTAHHDPVVLPTTPSGVSGAPHHAATFRGRVDPPPVRVYTTAGGRARPNVHLAIEALVRTRVDLAPERVQALLPEHRRICDLCSHVRCVAEISAMLAIPLGVTRILVAELAEAGMVAINQPADGGGSRQPDASMLERVLVGLRKL